MKDVIRIMSLPVDDGGCGWYRVRQPLAMIKKHTPHDAYIIDAHKDDMEAVTKALMQTDVVVMRPGSESAFWEMKAMPEFKHLKWVMDIDDNVEMISPYSEHYHEYGVEEYFDPFLKKWLWRDGERGFDLEKNRKRITEHVNIYQHVDMITVTTEKLAEYARQYNPNVAVLPNSVNLDRWWRLPLKPNKMLRIGWSGGISHYEDWYSIKEPLNEVMRKHPFTLVMAGQEFKGIIDKDNRHLVESHDWVPFKGHSYRMMCMNLDYAIIPLADLPFNHYKSPIKLIEMSAMGVPSIVANVEPYARELDKCDAFLPYQSPTEFKNTLTAAVQSAVPQVESRKKVQKYAQKYYDASKTAKMWTDAYQLLLD